MFQFLAITVLAISASALPSPDSGRIVGGNDIDISEAPYQASLQYLNSHFCGATIISSTFVATTAHCIDEFLPSEVTVRVGSTIRANGGVVVNVQNITQHPRYDNWTTDYDIAILQLDSELTFGVNIAAVKLPTLELGAGTDVIITGWGYLIEAGSGLPTNLQGATVQIISRLDCQSAYIYELISDRMICAGVNGGGKDACRGDSGGPLVKDGVLYGLVSWGYGCASAEYPGVYTNVLTVRDYINEITGL